ncbi:hypothetical protein KASHIRA_01890 [Serratia phage vB_SmaM-Kashira]|nr:hypothetical protein KASHIRA_01890 [Serratia phage vB_SmaM-Kashira]
MKTSKLFLIKDVEKDQYYLAPFCGITPSRDLAHVYDERAILGSWSIMENLKYGECRLVLLNPRGEGQAVA